MRGGAERRGEIIRCWLACCNWSVISSLSTFAFSLLLSEESPRLLCESPRSKTLMILKYVLKNFSKRKVRTILMIMSLIVSTGLIVTMSATVETIRQSNVDLIASAVGRFDLSISKVDTSPEPFLLVEDDI